MKNIVLYIITFCAFNLELNAQNNLHYSQYYNAPMFLNPALTGQIGDDLFRLNAHTRQQWSGLSESGGNLYLTSSGGLDFSLFNKHLGMGMYFMQDKAGDGIYNTLEIMPSMSYSFIIGDNALTFGSQFMYSSSQLDFSKLDFGSGVEPPYNPKSTYSDFNAGVNYKHDLYYLVANLGFSASHLLKPYQQFSKTVPGTRIPTMYKGYLNLDWDLTDRLKLLPGVFGVFQGGSSDFLVGSNISFKAIDGGTNGNRVIGGLWFRTNNGTNLESVIPKFGVRMNKLQILASYDWNIAMSKSGSSNYFEGLTNTFEISIIFTGKPKIVPPLLEDDFILNPRY